MAQISQHTMYQHKNFQDELSDNAYMLQAILLAQVELLQHTRNTRKYENVHFSYSS